VRASRSQDLMRTASPSCPWQPRRPARMTGHAKPQVGESTPSSQARRSAPMSQIIPEPVDGPVSVLVCFGWGTTTMTPACLRKNSSSEGGASLDLPLRIQARKGCPPHVPSPPSGWHFGPIFSVSMTATICCRHGSLPALSRPWVR
jgi:hypothetical protein